MTYSTRLAWVGGFFEAEGSIGIYGNSPELSIAQKCVEPLQLVQEELGGQIAAHKRGHWQWRLRRRAAIETTLRKIRGLLIEKRPQADLMLEWLETRDPSIPDLLKTLKKLRPWAESP